MRRLTVLIFLLAAAPAHAALGELPFEPRPDGATCLRATATPGTLAILGPLGRDTSATDLVTAGAGGTTLSARVRLGALVECAAVAVDPGGAAVMAGAVARGKSRAAVRAVVRDPSGAFGSPVRLGRAPIVGASVAAAVSPAGHAVVAWTQRRGGVLSTTGATRIVAVRRSPGGAFGRPEALTAWRRGNVFSQPAVAVGIDRAGTATVAWLQPVPRPRDILAHNVAAVAVAGPRAPFAVQRLEANVQDPSRVRVAVAPDGSSLLAYDGLDGIRAFERRLGAARFTAVLRTDDFHGRAPAVAVRNGGGGLIAWRSGEDGSSAGITAAVRTTAGPFGPPRVVAPAVRQADGIAVAELYAVTGGQPFPPPDDGNASLAAAVAPDGRAVLAWGAATDRLHSATTPRVVTGTLAAGFGPQRRLGGPIRDVNGVAPLFLGDGRVAIAWTDNSSTVFAPEHGRLHLALDGTAPAPDPPAPALRVVAAGTQRLFSTQALKVRATCRSSCDLRAWLNTHDGDPSAVTRTLRPGRSARLWLGSFELDPRQDRRVRVVVTATAPGGRLRTTVSRHVRIVHRPALAIPAPVRVRARRRGDAIHVTWRTAAPARRAFYVVEARRTRGPRNPSTGDLDRFTSVRGAGRTRFRATLRPRNARALRWVEVFGVSFDGGRAVGRVVVPVR